MRGVRRENSATEVGIENRKRAAVTGSGAMLPTCASASRFVAPSPAAFSRTVVPGVPVRSSVTKPWSERDCANMREAASCTSRRNWRKVRSGVSGWRVPLSSSIQASTSGRSTVQPQTTVRPDSAQHAAPSIAPAMPGRVVTSADRTAVRDRRATRSVPASVPPSTRSNALRSPATSLTMVSFSGATFSGAEALAGASPWRQVRRRPLPSAASATIRKPRWVPSARPKCFATSGRASRRCTVRKSASPMLSPTVASPVTQPISARRPSNQ